MEVAERIFPGPLGSDIDATAVIGVVVFGVNMIFALPPLKSIVEMTGNGVGNVMISG